jgi:hypothetical protein
MDVNRDGSVDISDPMAILNLLFKGGELPSCAAEPPPEPSLGERVAGVWISLDYGAIARLDADGGYLDVDDDDFANAFGGSDSPTLGTWVQTGERQISITSLTPRYDAAGSLAEVTKNVLVVSFDAEYTRGNGMLYALSLSSDNLDRVASCDVRPVGKGSPFSIERLCAIE